MKPLRNLMIFTTVLVGIALSTVLLVAYGRNYSDNAGGHPHGSAKQKNSSGQSEQMDSPVTKKHDAQSPSHGDKHPQTDAARNDMEHPEKDNDAERKDHAHRAPSAAGMTRPPSGQASPHTGAAPSSRPSKATQSTAVSGSPGLSHLYHVGARDFFLDQQALMTLSNEQQAALHRIKARVIVILTHARSKIHEEERELWEVTSSDHPNSDAIEKRVRSIESVRSFQRLSYIRSVGEAVLILNAQQRGALLGTGSAPKKSPAQHSSEHHRN